MDLHRWVSGCKSKLFFLFYQCFCIFFLKFNQICVLLANHGINTAHYEKVHSLYYIHYHRFLGNFL